MNVAFPGSTFDPVLFLPREVFFQVVDDQCPLQGAPQPSQILDEGSLDLRRVLSVESVRDEGLLGVKFVKDEVGVGLVGCRENDNLVQQRHVSEELDAERPHFVDHLPVLEMD